ncbi:MAG: asparagine synthase (glutamine-hydrolyzing) [Pseudomonadota bacterium]|nr:asparagine synthase (glutamine-hydrolyzing) [Pseudomonadota bacterium]
MCGITAIFSYSSDAPPVDRGELTKINERMNTRGPDGEGYWVSDQKDIGLAHKRLAIIDLGDHAAQPMALLDDNGNERFIISYNGEIYNFLELREQLLAQGCTFKSKSDTEVLLHLYARYGSRMLDKLRGMYAFVIWDCNKRTLFIARDPFGIKPLYIADNGRTIRVASQVKALLAGGKILTSSEAAGHVGFFLLGFVPEPYTLYSEIRCLLPGNSLLVKKGGQHKIEKFFDLRKQLANRNSYHPLGNQSEKLRESLLSSVNAHLVSDVPVGVFLSAGLDSATITGLASESSLSSLNTMTLQFDELKNTNMDEAPLANEIAEYFGTSHQTRNVVVSEFENELEKLFYSMDQPSIDGANTYFVSKEASKFGLKVALSGVGGDELFGGYPSFSQIPRLVNLIGNIPGLNQAGKVFRRISAPILKRFTSVKYASLLEYGDTFGGAYLLRRGLFMPSELMDFLDADFVSKGWDDLSILTKLNDSISGISNDMAKVSALELTWYMGNQLLRDSDWAGMAHSVEIRTPLVDAQLFGEIGHLGFKKKQMAQVLAKPLPNKILNRPKTGFYLPIREWLLGKNQLGDIDGGYKGWAKMVYSRV